MNLRKDHYRRPPSHRGGSEAASRGGACRPKAFSKSVGGRAEAGGSPAPGSCLWCCDSVRGHGRGSGVGFFFAKVFPPLVCGDEASYARSRAARAADPPPVNLTQGCSPRRRAGRPAHGYPATRPTPPEPGGGFDVRGTPRGDHGARGSAEDFVTF